MTADIVNLRQARKRKARVEAETRAARNRISFGISKAERQAANRITANLSKGLEGHRRSPPQPANSRLDNAKFEGVTLEDVTLDNG